jgi:hypothetical protein
MKDDHVAVLLEDLSSKFDGATEAVSAMAADVRELKQLIPEIADLKADIKVIKAAVTDQTHQLNDHKIRIAGLEQAA